MTVPRQVTLLVQPSVTVPRQVTLLVQPCVTVSRQVTLYVQPSLTVPLPLQVVMPSPLPEPRGSTHNQGSWLEDYSFPQSPAVTALRDAVSNRVTLVRP